MKKDYYWRFPESRLSSIDRFPDEFLVPAAEMASDPFALFGTRIFLIARAGSQFSYLFGVVVVQGIAMITEGVSKGDFELFTDRLRSFWTIGVDSSDKKSWELSIPNEDNGIREASREIAEAALAAISGHETYSYIDPMKRIEAIPDQVRIAIFTSRNAIQAAVTSFAYTLRSFRFGEIQRYQKKREVSPFGTLAIAHLRIALGEEWSDCEEVIVRYDRLLQDTLKTNGELVELTETWIDPSPRVDVILSPLERENIRPRQFIRKSAGVDLDGWLEKTQEAEVVHQEILTNLFQYLKELDYDPMFSRSVDLALLGSAGLLLFEIKSAKLENFLRQGERSAIQLIRYSLAFEEHGMGTIGGICVISSPEVPELEEYLTRFLKRIGYMSIFYRDSESANDRRFAGLKELVGSFKFD